MRGLRAALLGGAVLACGCGCGSSPVAAHRATTPAGGSSTRALTAAADGRLRPPHLAGAGSIAPAPPPGDRPGRAPAQAGPRLRGHPLPTDQWWTSALVGPWTEPLIAGPVGVQVTAEGVAISYRPPVASPDHVVQPFRPAVVAAGPLEDVQVTGYGAFDVVLESRLAGGGSVQTTIVQGSPLVYLRFRGVERPSLQLQGTPRDVRVDHGRLGATVGGERWQSAAATGTWRVRGADAVLSGAGPEAEVAVAPQPAGAGPGWSRAFASAARDPVVDTTETLSYLPRRGVARQVLTMRRARGGAGPWALNPLQSRYLRGSTPRLRGGYASSTGRMPLVAARSIAVEVPAPGLLPGVPRVPLGRAARSAVRRDLGRDLAQRPATGGSYFGLKELAREASVAEVAAAVGDEGARRRALALLRPRLVDWLTYSGPGDAHYFAYDPTWGGLIGVPAEFGAQDYNDHHLQDGYLVRAAAVEAEADPSFARRYGAVVDAVIRDYAGAGGNGGDGLPAQRVWDAGVEHSWASGYALFADGNDQESSSEAVAAWAAIARWGLVTGRPALTDLGVARYAFEAAAARMYWLGDERVVPKGYAHRTVGIVWGDKIDHATWFSAAPAAIQGIQLIPAGFEGLYRWDAAAARARLASLRAESGGRIAQWGNLFAPEEALFDPARARAILEARLPDPEPSTSRALVRYLVETLAVTGPPAPSVAADGPYGLAMRRGGHLSFLAVDPTARPRTVTFRRGGHVLARLRVPPRGSATQGIATP